MSNTSIRPIEKTLSGTTTPGQSGPVSDSNEEVLQIPQSPSITGASPSDCLVSYLAHSLGESYPTTEMQSVYSTASADWAISQPEIFQLKYRLPLLHIFNNYNRVEKLYRYLFNS